MSYDEMKKYRSYSIYTDTSTLRRKKSYKDYLSSGYSSRSEMDLFSRPKKTKKTRELEIQRKKFEERYCYLYENAPIILFFMVNDLGDDIFSEEVKRRTGFEFREKEAFLERSSKDLSCFVLLEDLFLGEEIYGNYLNTFIETFHKHTFLSPKLSKEFDFSSNIGIGKYDECMKLLVDIVYSFIDSECISTTLVYRKTSYGYQNVYNLYNNTNELYIDNSSLLEKKKALSFYYDILGYRNCRSGSVTFNDKGIDYRFIPAKKTLVRSNPFIKALQPSLDTFSMTRSLGSSIYFKLHDEIPWINNCICNSIHGVENGCNTDFFVKEEDIFYKDDKFNVICPCCGAICTTGIGPGKFKEKIEERIKKRFIDDKYFDRKIAILSELHSMGSVVIEDGKKKVKV